MNHHDNQRNLLVIKASAGSGKTYNLALQYIKHLLFTTQQGKLVPRRGGHSIGRPLNAHRQLLAITFTNKATDEMKARIVSELYSLSRRCCKSKYLDGFMADTGLDAVTIRQLARHALTELLFDYSNFNVSTIDSFFQTILRNFARELDRDFNYDIQLEEDYAVRVAVHKFLLSLGKESQPTQVDKWVQDYQRRQIHGDVEKKKWKFFDDSGDLGTFAKQINSELFRSRMDDIRDYLGRIEDGRFYPDFSKIRAFLTLMSDVVKDCEAAVTDNMQALKTALEPLADNLWKGRSFQTFLSKGGTDPLSKKSWDTIDEKKVLNQFGKNKPDSATVVALQQQVEEHFKLREESDFFKHIKDNLGLLGMLAMIDLFLEEYRHESNSILIGDTNELIGTVLESGSAFVYERVGTTISNFMIDEFQDTSAKQYENFRGLLEESLASGNFNMLIGDAKQSIYRFRNADPTVFREKVGENFADDIYTVKPASTEYGSINYRSSENIITFNNRLFEFIRDLYQDRPTVVNTYQDVCQGMPGDIKTAKVPGYVRLITDDYAALTADPVIKASLPADYSADSEAAVDVLTVLPGYLLKLHERYEWRKIGILVNKNKEGDKVVECILDYNKRTMGEEIRIISGESLLLNNSPIIRRIIAMLRFIDISQTALDEDSDDEERDKTDCAQWRKRESDIRLYTAMSAFIRELAAHPDATPSETGSLLASSLSALAGNDNGNASKQDESQTSTSLLENLLPPPGELTTLVSIVETIISYFKADARARADVDRETAFLLAFQDTVMQFASMRNGGSVREFLKFWDEKKGTLAVSSSSHDNAIQIMSIHKAKGLEFDCVVIPFADWELDGNSRETDYWMPREEFVDLMKSLHHGIPEPASDIVPPLLHIDKATAVALNKRGRLGELSSAFVTKQVDDVLIDNLNKTYVAMTRPRHELHVFARGKDSTVAGPLALFARDGGLMTPVMTEPSWYELGTPPTLEDFKALQGQEKDDDACAEPEAEQIRITGYPVNAIPSGLKVRLDHASSSQIDSGIRLHSILSRIHDRDDVDRAIAQGIKHGVITSDPGDPCSIDCIETHVRGPILAAGGPIATWFDPANKVYSERTITSASDSIWDADGIENLRPDRIVRLPDGNILVIDYKSGERNDKKYCGQVKKYIAQLRRIFPDVPIGGRIWYIVRDEVIDEQGHEVRS
ncbi:MAG: UvrD-helicase domain-containing protein [Muribaculaceae bacterium]|nr:UvrD-helicase domain-containing protein [Muribaculaceae bacterium]